MRFYLIVICLLFVSHNVYCQGHINFILEINNKYVFGGEVGRFQIYPTSSNGVDTVNVDYIIGELQLKNNDLLILNQIPSDSIVAVDFDYYHSYNRGPTVKQRYFFTMKKELLTDEYLIIKLFDGSRKKESCFEYVYEYVSPLGIGVLPKDKKRVKKRNRRK